jgi:SAM-dependent methyltransferase
MSARDPLWETIHSGKAWGRYPALEIVRFLARTFPDPPVEGSLPRGRVHVLDLGCGGGAHTWLLAREGFRVTAFDGALAAVQRTRQRVRAEHLPEPTGLVQADAAALPFKSAGFDAVLDSAVLCTQTPAFIRRLLDEIGRVLRPGGRFFSTGLFSRQTTGCGTGTEIAPDTFRDMTEGPLAGTGQVHFFSRESLVAWWEAAGFVDLVIDRQHRSERGGAVVIDEFSVLARRP